MANVAGKRMWSANAEQAFITHGFSNWKDAAVKFPNHEKSKCHKEAHLKVVTLPATTQDIAENLSSQLKSEKLDAWQCFLEILSNIKFLGRQGLALRGHGDGSDSNFVQLLNLRGEDDPRVQGWMEKKTDIHLVTSRMKS